MPAEVEPPTCTTYIWAAGQWLEAGTGQLDADGSIQIQLDRMPINPDTFSGYVCVPPIGKLPTAKDFAKCKRLELDSGPLIAVG